MSKARREELNNNNRRYELLEKLEKQTKIFQDSNLRNMCNLRDPEAYYGPELPF